MWLFCGGMYRSGSTLQFQLVAEVVELAGRGRRVEWCPPEEFVHVREKYSGYDGYKVFKSHVCTEAMREEVLAGRGRAFYIYRDIRDVMVSLIRKERVSLQSLLKGVTIRVALESFERWTALPKVMISRYEETVSDLAGEVRRIGRELGVEMPESVVMRIAADFTLEKQRRRIHEASGQNRMVSTKNGKQYDSVTLLHPNHIASGRVGEWNDFFDASEKALIEGTFGDWLRRNGYPLSGGQRTGHSGSEEGD